MVPDFLDPQLGECDSHVFTLSAWVSLIMAVGHRAGAAGLLVLAKVCQLQVIFLVDMKPSGLSLV